VSDPVFLDVEDVLLIHEEQLRRYGGSLGLRDRGLLESAVAMPRATASGELLHENLFAMAAAYAFHIAQNQPFVDGNKRTGLLAAGFDAFLEGKLRDSAFRGEFEVARAEIAATDALIRALEGARAGRGISKAELARRISVKPEIIRRLLTDADGNPTVSTVLKVAAALDCHLELVPNRGRREAPGPGVARQARAATVLPEQRDRERPPPQV
jgi:prophage maintenance system killer protein/DNA-binding phage protein